MKSVSELQHMSLFEKNCYQKFVIYYVDVKKIWHPGDEDLMRELLSKNILINLRVQQSC